MAFFSRSPKALIQGFLFGIASAVVVLCLSSLALTEFDSKILRKTEPQGPNATNVRDCVELKPRATIITEDRDNAEFKPKATIITGDRDYAELKPQTANVTEARANVEPGCSKTPSPKKLPPWLPSPNKYLLAHCYRQRWSNRLYCTERALILAALLNRTLIMPSDDVCVGRSNGTSMHLMFDIPHMRQCLLQGQLRKQHSYASSSEKDGEENESEENDLQSMELREQVKLAKEVLGTGVYVISLSEYLSLHKTRKLHVGRLMCENQGKWWSPCPLKTCTAGDLISHPLPTPPPVPLFSKYKPMPLKDLKKLAAATSSVRVLSFGDTFNAKIKEFPLKAVSPVARMFESSCNSLFQPAPSIFELAAATERWLNGSSYGAVHFRRGDFKFYCRWKGFCTYWSVEQTADCIATELAKAGISNLFVASNAAAGETESLASKLYLRGIQVFMLGTPDESSWFSNMLAEKLICAKASMFISQKGSTFSYSILQMRAGLRTGSCTDRVLCEGRKEGFIPSNPSHLRQIPLSWSNLSSNLHAGTHS